MGRKANPNPFGLYFWESVLDIVVESGSWDGKVTWLGLWSQNRLALSAKRKFGI